MSIIYLQSSELLISVECLTGFSNKNIGTILVYISRNMQYNIPSRLSTHFTRVTFHVSILHWALQLVIMQRVITKSNFFDSSKSSDKDERRKSINECMGVNISFILEKGNKFALQIKCCRWAEVLWLKSIRLWFI